MLIFIRIFVNLQTIIHRDKSYMKNKMLMAILYPHCSKRPKVRRLLTFSILFGAMVSTSCTKDGDIIYQPDLEDQASTAPLVTVIYDPNALGDRGYNDLIYKGVEQAARRHGLRTMQLSPTTASEGLAYLQRMLQTMTATEDTIRRLFIVAAASYDDFIRKYNSQLEANPRTDLLYIETNTPLEGKGSTFYMPYYGAMYEAGAIAPIESPEVLLVGANPLVETVALAIKGFTDGFESSPIALKDKSQKKLVTAWLSDKVYGGFTVPDSTALQLMRNQQWQSYSHLIVPVCGGAGATFQRFCELLAIYSYVGIDCEVLSHHCNFSVVKHIDRAINRCIDQWLSPDGIPKHQTFGLADGYTEVVLHPYSDTSKSTYAELLSEETQQSIHQEAIRKEAEYEK